MNFRRIVQRGLVNYSGELWYREGLPSDVFRRLVVRKENETPLDRFSGDYEELMTYADFRDLADIIVGNEALRERLAVLEPRDGVSLLDRLHELHEMRRNAASSDGVSDADADKLSRYFTEFRDAIKTRRKAPKKHDAAQSSAEAADRASAAPPDEPVIPPDPEHEGETLDSIFDADDEPVRRPEPRPGRLVVKVSSGGLADRESTNDDGIEKGIGGTETPVTDVSESPFPPAGIDDGETPVTEISTRPQPDHQRDLGPVEEAEGLERALRDGDNAAILKSLHVEITEIADGMLRRDPKQGHPVWRGVCERGWFDGHRDIFELELLEVFYGLADRFLDAYSSGAKSSELKAMLADAGFSKLLLKLREMFLASRAKA